MWFEENDCGRHKAFSVLISWHLLWKLQVQQVFLETDSFFLVSDQDIGAGKGKYYAVNFPLRDGIDDDSYESIFKPVSSFIVILCETVLTCVLCQDVFLFQDRSGE